MKAKVLVWYIVQCNLIPDKQESHSLNTCFHASKSKLFLFFIICENLFSNHLNIKSLYTHSNFTDIIF